MASMVDHAECLAAAERQDRASGPPEQFILLPVIGDPDIPNIGTEARANGIIKECRIANGTGQGQRPTELLRHFDGQVRTLGVLHPSQEYEAFSPGLKRVRGDIGGIMYDGAARSATPPQLVRLEGTDRREPQPGMLAHQPLHVLPDRRVECVQHAAPNSRDGGESIDPGAEVGMDHVEPGPMLQRQPQLVLFIVSVLARATRLHEIEQIPRQDWDHITLHPRIAAREHGAVAIQAPQGCNQSGQERLPAAGRVRGDGKPERGEVKDSHGGDDSCRRASRAALELGEIRGEKSLLVDMHGWSAPLSGQKAHGTNPTDTVGRMIGADQDLEELSDEGGQAIG